jgi:hypothetical protein
MSGRSLESTRPGRIIQAFGVLLICLGIGLAAYDSLVTPLWVTLINAVTISNGLWCVFGPGRLMVREAREHKAFMDEHRKRAADLDRGIAQLVNRQWN